MTSLNLEEVALRCAQPLVGRRQEIVAEYCLLLLVAVDIRGMKGTARLVSAVLRASVPQVAVEDNGGTS